MSRFVCFIKLVLWVDLLCEFMVGLFVSLFGCLLRLWLFVLNFGIGVCVIVGCFTFVVFIGFDFWVYFG